MHLFKTLLAAVGVILSAQSALSEIQGFASGWKGPGFYNIASVATGTVVDLYESGSADGTPIHGSSVPDVPRSSSFGKIEHLPES